MSSAARFGTFSYLLILGCTRAAAASFVFSHPLLRHAVVTLSPNRAREFSTITGSTEDAPEQPQHEAGESHAPSAKWLLATVMDRKRVVVLDGWFRAPGAVA
jgi:hypothetical protein